MGIVEQMTGVFTEIGEWIVSAITQLQAVFYNAETGLTFMGTLAVVGLAIAVIFLVVGVIQNFLRLRSQLKRMRQEWETTPFKNYI